MDLPTPTPKTRLVISRSGAGLRCFDFDFAYPEDREKVYQAAFALGHVERHTYDNGLTLTVSKAYDTGEVIRYLGELVEEYQMEVSDAPGN